MCYDILLGCLVFNETLCRSFTPTPSSSKGKFTMSWANALLCAILSAVLAAVLCLAFPSLRDFVRAQYEIAPDKREFLVQLTVGLVFGLVILTVLFAWLGWVFVVIYMVATVAQQVWLAIKLKKLKASRRVKVEVMPSE